MSTEQHRPQPPSPRRRHRRRLRRRPRRQDARERAGRDHADRQEQPASVPAAALPGRDRRPVVGADRAGAARDVPQAAQCARAARRRRPHRPRAAHGADDRRRGQGDPVRHADRRDRRHALLLRTRRVVADRSGDEVARRRAPRAHADPRRVRDRRAERRPRRAGGVADVRGRRRRAHRRRARRADRAAGPPRPQGRLPQHRSVHRARAAARRDAARARHLPAEPQPARRRRPAPPGRRGRAERAGHRTSPSAD